ncbi:histone-lysine N-methyltransferase NSD2-like isoform X1 [Alosa alosa]|uniref:histone-lysine N-methyltransferase NSD2-like isoform X1 n=2 Tax=Alosa alosa TaxID=278164 RepID=UPI0020154AC8|nr:histone-lysine N-methyltransferase NSD2-like isoform X1 [Alosa alosa]
MTTNRKAPERDALEHVVKAIDKTAHLEVKFINSVKGQGVFAKSHFEKGNFVVEDRGQLIKSEESQRRRRVYHSQCAVFLFDFYWQERLWCIDAAQEDGSLGRLVNDENIRPNCKMKKLIVEGKPHLCLFALRNIIPGEEITYNYGGTDWPWRNKIEEEPVETMSPAVEAPETSPQLLEAPETSPQLAVLSSVSEKKIGKKRLMTKSAAVEAPKTSQPPAVLSTVSEKKIEEEPVVTNSTAVEAPQTSQQPAVLSSVSKKKIGEKRTVIESGVADSYETPEHCGLLSPKKKESSDQDQPYVPKLRRTKSIQVIKALIKMDIIVGSFDIKLH